MWREIWHSWVAVTIWPELQTFEQEKAKADLGTAALSTLLASLAVALLSAVSIVLLLASTASLNSPEALGREFASEAQIWGLVASPWFLGLLALGMMVILPLSAIFTLFLTSAVLFLFSRIYGGRGEFTTQTYLLSIFVAPLNLISTLAGFVPCLGSLVQVGLFFYSLYPLTMALRATHGLAAGRAVAAWATPLAVLVLFFICGLAALIAGISRLSGSS